MTDLTMLSGLRVLVVGLGREGQALATYLAKHNVTVAATDIRSSEQLGDVATTLQDAGVSLSLGEHPLSLLDEADLLFVSPGVPLESPLLEAARANKIPLSTESRLFCHLCPAPIIGITGSSGKTTTTTLVHKIMEADGKTSWLGGNIGHPLISVVDQIQPDDIVVMELSSFQLEYFHARLNKGVDIDALPSGNPQQLAALLDNWSPSIGALLNITPNHLDRHPTMKHYVRAKRAVVEYQKDDTHLVLGLDNDMTRTIGAHFESGMRWFSTEAQMPNGAGIEGNNLVLFDQDGATQILANKKDVKLRGTHNVRNILAACLLADEAGASIEAMQQVITTFTGVEHRLELVREHNAISYFNDSIATSPERLIAALHSFTESIVLLAGGRDKHLPWQDAARLMLHKVHYVILFGEAQSLIAQAINRARTEVSRATTMVHQCDNLEEAVQLAAQVAQVGDVVLLSPGCASFDAFSSYVERGQRFRELVNQLE